MAGKMKKGARCSSACTTREHRTFGECMRAKGLQIHPNLMNTQAQKEWDSELQAYRDANAQGIMPAGTSMSSIRQAEEISQATGVAYQADKPMWDVTVS